MEANVAVAEVIGNLGHCNGRKRKHYTTFSDEDRGSDWEVCCRELQRERAIVQS